MTDDEGVRSDGLKPGAGIQPTTRLSVHPAGPPSAPRPVAGKIVVVAGPDEGRELPLDTVVQVGTDDECDLVLADPTVSRRHVQLTCERGRFRVKDLDSSNGTYLGSTRIGEAEIPLGAVLRLGNTELAVQPRWYVREVPPSASRAFGELCGESLAMREIFAILERVAPSDVTVLVEGESGTGKELVARSIHRASPRADKPYVVFDCGAVPSDLAESELFGHKKGAFTGAVSDREGAFHRADGGMICLDEIGELPLDLQPKLLRVLETGEVRSVGSDKLVHVDVRVVASTNRDLHAESLRGRFRSDLFYRLAVVRIRLPPLRQRPEDVRILVERLLEGKLPPGDVVEGPNLRTLVEYGWPGNVRELRNVLARAVTLSRRPGQPPTRFAELVFNLGPGSTTTATIGGDLPGVASHLPYKEARSIVMDRFDRAYVDALLERFHQNVSQAANAAGVSRTFLYELLKRAGDDRGGGEGT